MESPNITLKELREALLPLRLAEHICKQSGKLENSKTEGQPANASVQYALHSSVDSCAPVHSCTWLETKKTNMNMIAFDVEALEPTNSDMT
mmetsp:Transcript_35421/g.87095  ORF Transcript_35421/g.87095 Transcript_35421/m.87095 type:complete len:91 (-) Transcript_35421:50-322(-)